MLVRYQYLVEAARLQHVLLQCEQVQGSLLHNGNLKQKYFKSWRAFIRFSEILGLSFRKDPDQIPHWPLK
jgi:hypothetical protein